MNPCANAVQAIGPCGRLDVTLDRVEWTPARSVATGTRPAAQVAGRALARVLRVGLPTEA